jgi:hypothetical protein
MRPSATAAAFLPSSVVMSSISPVAILAMMTALPMASAGRLGHDLVARRLGGDALQLEGQIRRHGRPRGQASEAA